MNKKYAFKGCPINGETKDLPEGTSSYSIGESVYKQEGEPSIVNGEAIYPMVYKPSKKPQDLFTPDGV